MLESLIHQMKRKVIQAVSKQKNSRQLKQEDISYEEVKKMQRQDKNTELIDVRSQQEYREGHLPNSSNIPLYELEQRLEKEVPDKQTTTIFCCASGHRSKQAVQLAKQMGYERVYDIAGGLQEIEKDLF